MARLVLADQGICTQCMLPKELRLTKPRWCKECYSKYQKEYHTVNREKIRPQKNAGNKRFRQTEKGKIAHKNGKYNRKARTKGTIKAAEWKALCNRYDNKCLRCGGSGELTIDHIVPLIHGGANTIANAQPLCMPCNRWKGTQTIDYRY